jgi:hypothetical protein
MDLKPCVAAVPGSILLNVEELRKNYREIRRDPICYIEDGDTIVILDHYGDFPKEKEAVRRAMRAAVEEIMS